MDEVTRRNRLDLCTPAEKAIYEATYEIEKIGADVRLTEAQNLLDTARNLIADYIDNVPTLSVEKSEGEEADFLQLPFEGICGKCANPSLRLNKDYLCENCIGVGVLMLPAASIEGIQSIQKHVRLRAKPSAQPLSQGGVESIDTTLSSKVEEFAKEVKSVKDKLLAPTAAVVENSEMKIENLADDFVAEYKKHKNYKSTVAADGHLATGFVYGYKKAMEEYASQFHSPPVSLGERAEDIYAENFREGFTKWLTQNTTFEFRTSVLHSIADYLSTLSPSTAEQGEDDRKYPCYTCGQLRTKEEGGTTFTLCDDCWDKHYKTGKYAPPSHVEAAGKEGDKK